MASPSAINHQECYCSWCGALDAAFVCACKQVSFCGQKCLRSAWTTHRLVCTQTNPAKPRNNNLLLYGDVVTIQGLQSQSGQAMNGRLAEVQSFNKDKERYAVRFSADVGYYKVKTVLVKRENLTLQVGVSDAALQAKAAAKNLTNLNKSPDPDFVKKRIAAMNKISREEVKRMSGQELVARIRDRDADFVQTLMAMCSKPGFLNDETLQTMFESGLIDACMEQVFHFPLSIDDGDPIMSAPEYISPSHIDRSGKVFRASKEVVFCQQGPMLLSLLRLIMMVSGVRMFLPVTPFAENCRREICRKLSPLIMLVSNKKRRIFGTTDNWWAIQRQLLATLCWISQTNNGIQALHNSLADDVLSALFEQMVMIWTANPLFLLRFSSFRVKKQLNLGDEATLVAQEVVSIASNLSSRDKEHGSEKRFERLVMTRVPPGACGEMVGRTLASCFFDVTAQMFLRMKKFSDTDKLWFFAQEFFMVFAGLHSCSMVVKMELGRDAGFEHFALTELHSNTRSNEEKVKDFVAWAQGRMTK